MMNTTHERLWNRFARGIALAIVGAWAVAAVPARGESSVELEEVRIGLGENDAFKVGAWTPVWVQLKGGAAPFHGELTVAAGDDDGSPTTTRQKIELSAGESQTHVIYTRLGTGDASMVVEVRDESGRRLVSRSREQASRLEPQPIAPVDAWILSAGQALGIDAIREAGGFNRTNGQGTDVTITPLDAAAGRLPDRWLGYDGVRAVILDTADPAVMAMLAGPQGQALVEWTRRGGHLVVGLGANWREVVDTPLGSALPGVLVGRDRVQSLEALDTFSDSSKPITPPGSPAHMAVRVEGVDARGGKVLAATGGLPLVARGPLGFGRITLISLDLEEEVFGAWVDRGSFWIRALDLKRDRFDEDQAASLGGTSGRFYSTGVTDLATQLRVALEQFPKVRMVSFGLVAFLIFLYILAIGPGDYFFLKKILKRMELTWITFPLIVTAVSLLAYAAAHRLKGSELRVNKLDAIDVDQVSGLVRGRSWATLFSPQNRDYDLAFTPVAIESGEGEPSVTRSGSDDSPQSDSGMEVVSSWFGVPEAQFGGMGGAGSRFAFVGGGYAYAPAGGLERLERVRVPIWSTKTLGARWFGTAAPVLESDLALSGFDRLAGTVTNLQSYPLTDAVLAFDRRAYLLGSLAPGQTMRVELQPDRSLSGELKAREPNYITGRDQPEGGAPRLDRADLLLAAMFHESESRRAGGEQPLGNAVLHDMDLTGQLALHRPMLVARIPGPGSRLTIGNAPDDPEVEQTTILRVILPLRSPAAAGP